ncbi:uncharacterized protein LOC110062005 [Orbicella faveolata]|uniref:uncharacterized protein LOC110062005 n=1 Tax=Orbicella faveolata TaxID=48498 RepID=UPI0009E5F603|nr:uncharacterized protein LOC110062005 [Orbicella faveolata]
METAGTIGEIPVSSVLFSSAADNTSVSKSQDQEEPTGHQTLLDKMMTWNPGFSSMEGNLHSEAVNEEESDGEYAIDLSSGEDSDDVSEVEAGLDSEVDGD